MDTTKYFPSIEAIDRASEVLSEILEPTPFMKNNNLSVYGGNDTCDISSNTAKFCILIC